MDTASSLVDSAAIPVSTPVRYDEDERRLKEIFIRINPRLVSILDGIARALADEQNPDRFNQAAHSIRGITGILVREMKTRASLSKTASKKTEAIINLEQSFDKALTLIPCFSTSRIDAQDQHNYVKGKFEQLVEMLLNGAITVRQSLRKYIGEDKELVLLPKTIREESFKSIKNWDKLNSYFVKLTHYDGKELDPKEFSQNWSALKSIMIWSLSRIYDVAVPLIDEAISKDVPPDA